MNYVRSINKAAIGKRIFFSWVVVAIIFFLIGFGIGLFFTSEGSPVHPDLEHQKELKLERRTNCANTHYTN